MLGIRLVAKTSDFLGILCAHASGGAQRTVLIRDG